MGRGRAKSDDPSTPSGAEIRFVYQRSKMRPIEALAPREWSVYGA
jgi:hypothetical protein